MRTRMRKKLDVQQERGECRAAKEGLQQCFPTFRAMTQVVVLPWALGSSGRWQEDAADLSDPDLERGEGGRDRPDLRCC
jgi:hypothetical protein